MSAFYFLDVRLDVRLVLGLGLGLGRLGGLVPPLFAG